MPLKKSGAMRAFGLAAVACGALALTPAASLAADSPNECSYIETSKAFAFLGDTSEYFLAPGGDFEGELAWTVSGPAQQKPVSLAILGTKALSLDAGAAMDSQLICVDKTRITLRFMVKKPAAGTLAVEAVDTAGKVTSLTSLDAATAEPALLGQGWVATPIIPLSTKLGITSGSRDVNVRIVAKSGDWNIDNVWIDPYRS
jgi:hypothetical protein